MHGTPPVQVTPTRLFNHPTEKEAYTPSDDDLFDTPNDSTSPSRHGTSPSESVKPILSETPDSAITPSEAQKRLKPEFRPGIFSRVSPSTLYADPSKRQDQFVPSDKAGLAYLNGLGITHEFLINQIKKNHCSISKALDIIQKNKQVIEVALKKDTRSEIRNVLNNLQQHPYIRYFIECGLLSMEQLLQTLKGRWNQDIAWWRVLSEPLITILKPYLDKGELSMEDALKMSFTAQFAFQNPAVQQYLQENRLSVKDVLAMRSHEAFEMPVVQKYLREKRLKMQDVLNMSTFALMALKNPVILKYVESGALKIKDVLDITEDARRAFEMPQVQDYIKANKLLERQAVRQIVEMTKTAGYVLFGHFRYQYGPKDKLDIGKILKIGPHVDLAHLNVRDFIQ